MNRDGWNAYLTWRYGAIWRRRWCRLYFIDHISSRVMVTFLSISSIISPVTPILKNRIRSVMFSYANTRNPNRVSISSVRPCFMTSNRFSADELRFWSVKTVLVSKKFQLASKKSKSITWIEGRIFPVHLPNLINRIDSLYRLALINIKIDFNMVAKGQFSTW